MKRRAEKTILLTGFEPFGGDRVNPSELMARRYDGASIASHRVAGVVLPCAFGASVRALRAAIARHRPDAVVCLGLAAGRAAVTPERVAINVDDARIPDNAGAQPVDRPVVRGGPAAYWSTLPIKAIVQALRDHHIPAEVSQTAGTFVCNHVFYSLMHELRRGRNRVRGGFVHVPALPAQAARGQPALAIETIHAAVGIVLATVASRRRDLRRTGGAEH